MTSFSSRCSTHTLPLDSRARFLAASITRGETSEWSTATSSLSYIDQPHSLANGLSDESLSPAIARPGDPVGAGQRNLGHGRGLDGQRHQVIGLEMVDVGLTASAGHSGELHG